MNRKERQNAQIVVGLLIASFVVLYVTTKNVDAAPATGNNNSNDAKNGRNSRPGLLSNLFRRQTSSNNDQPAESDTEDPQTQTELEAQKFMDSLPNPGANSGGPTTFRERVTGTFGVLRDGVSNHFKSIRDNFSDTVEDLRDTWSGGE